MRIVLDANVLVSAAIQRGASHRIVAAWLAGTADFEVVMCPELLGEVREVLTTRPRLRKWISLQNAAGVDGRQEPRAVVMVREVAEVADLNHDRAALLGRRTDEPLDQAVFPWVSPATSTRRTSSREVIAAAMRPV